MKKKISTPEFVSLMALLMSLVALAVDAMLPALPDIALSLELKDTNDTQYVVTVLFLGMSFGQVFFGPISDSYGRKPSVYLGIVSYMIGCLISVFSQSFQVMLLGRALQGFGAASTRVVTTAMIRDRYSGREMARIMSFITMVFILVPALAPILGQVVLLWFHWRAIFAILLILAALGFIWFFLRQPETHPKSKRSALSVKNLNKSAKEALTHPVTLGYSLASACIFGSFVVYLSTSQKIFQEIYGLGQLFPIFFGALALSIGAASFVNARLVMRYGMEKLCLVALMVFCLLSSGFLLFLIKEQGEAELLVFMIYMSVSFFSVGILFGNFNSLALEPMGHIAGVATAAVSSFQTLLSVGIGSFIGSFYDQSVIPLVSGFAGLGFLSLIIVVITMKKAASGQAAL